MRNSILSSLLVLMSCGASPCEGDACVSGASGGVAGGGGGITGNFAGGDAAGGDAAGGNAAGGNAAGGNVGGGNAAGGNAAGGNVGGGNAAGGNVAGGNAAGGNVAGGNAAGGNVAGGNVAGGNVAGGNVGGGNAAGGNSAGGNVAGGNVAGGNVGGGNAAGGNSAGGNAAGGNAAGGNAVIDPVRSTLQAIPTTLQVGETSTVTLTLRNAQGLPLPNTAVTWRTTSPVQLTSSSSVVTNASGEATVTVRTTTPTTATVTAEAATFNRSTTVSWTPGPIDVALSSLIASPMTVVANGTSASTLTLTLRDAFGNALPGRSVTMNANGAGPAPAPASGVTSASGQFVSSLASTLVQTRQVTATSAGASLTSNVSFVAGPPASVTLSATPTSIVAGSTSGATLTAGVRDAFSAPVPGVVVSFQVSGAGFLTTGAVTTNGSGLAATTLRSNVTGVSTVTASINGLTTTAQVTITPGTPSAATSTLVLSPTSTAPGVPSTATLTVRDALGNLISGRAVAFSLPLGTAVPGTGTTDVNGRVVTQVSSSVIGSRVVTASFGVSLFATLDVRDVCLGTPSFGGLAALSAFPSERLVAFDLDANGRRDLVGIRGNLLGSALNLDGGAFSATAAASSGSPDFKAVAVGNFTGDRRAEVAFLDQVAGQLVVGTLLSDGGVERQFSADAGFGPTHVLSVDLDRDGTLDLVTCASADDSLRVFFGADGGFLTAVQSSTADWAQVVVANDFDGDGRTDLAVAGDRQVAVHYNLGARTFSPPSVTSTGGTVRALASGQFDGDGGADLGLLLSSAGATLQLFTGTSARSLVPQTAPWAYSDAQHLLVVDETRDGIGDLLAVGSVTQVFVGSATGVFTPGRVLETGPVPAAALATDLTGDGIDDLVLGRNSTTLLWPGRAAGSFELPSAAAGSASATGHWLVTDLDLNGLPDLVAGSGTSSWGAVTVWQTTGPGQFAAAVTTGVAGGGLAAWAGTSSSNNPSLTTANAFLAGNGSGGLTPLSYSTYSPRDGSAVAVLQDQIVRSTPRGLESFHPWILSSRPAILGPARSILRTADLDGDGSTDLLAASTSAVDSYTGPGLPTRRTLTLSGTSLVTDARLIDLDHDGRLDLLLARRGLQVHTQLASGAFSTAAQFPAPTIGATALAVGDLNGDGWTDVVAVEDDGDGVATVLINDRGTLRPSQLGLGGQGQRVVIADLTGDSRPDLAVLTTTGRFLPLIRSGCR